MGVFRGPGGPLIFFARARKRSRLLCLLFLSFRARAKKVTTCFLLVFFCFSAHFRVCGPLTRSSRQRPYLLQNVCLLSLLAALFLQTLLKGVCTRLPRTCHCTTMQESVAYDVPLHSIAKALERRKERHGRMRAKSATLPQRCSNSAARDAELRPATMQGNALPEWQSV